MMAEKETKYSRWCNSGYRWCHGCIGKRSWQRKKLEDDQWFAALKKEAQRAQSLYGNSRSFFAKPAPSKTGPRPHLQKMRGGETPGFFRIAAGHMEPYAYSLSFRFPCPQNSVSRQCETSENCCGTSRR